MDIKVFLRKIADFISKYRYAALVLAVGIALMLLPSGSHTDNAAKADSPQPEQTAGLTLEKRLAQMLSQIDGAGKVEVMLSVGTGEETVYQYDEDTSITDASSVVKREVVTVTDAQRNQNGLIRQINPPEYLGAIVVCEGAENPVIQLAIVDAVSKITGLGANRITVLKMK